MAIMHPAPDNVVFSNPYSERKVYEEFQRQLNDHIHVFYSLQWIVPKEKGKDLIGEADFIIVDPDNGILVVEVKGGHKIFVDGPRWTIQDSPDPMDRHDTKNPYDQARKSRFALKELYESSTNRKLQCAYGSIVVFPFYDVNSSISREYTENNTITYSKMDSLQKWINTAFISVCGSKKQMTKDEFDHVIGLLDECASSDPPIGASLEKTMDELQDVSVSQDATISMLYYYDKAIFVGAAGTGKTYMAISKATEAANQGKKTLYICFNTLNAKRVKQYFEEKDLSVDVMTFHHLMGHMLHRKIGVNEEISDEEIQRHSIEPYDAIMVDEAKDLSNNWASIIRKYLLSNDSPILYVFYDEDQNIFNKDFGAAFEINYPPFILKRNLRNTSTIWQWTCMNTEMGKESIPNYVEGIRPYIYRAAKKIAGINELERKLRELRDNNVAAGDIVILTDVGKAFSLIKDCPNLGGYPLLDLTQEEYEDDCVANCTIQAYKGLESPVVFCLLKDGYHDKALEYVAFSRAKSLLYVIYYK